MGDLKSLKSLHAALDIKEYCTQYDIMEPTGFAHLDSIITGRLKISQNCGQYGFKKIPAISDRTNNTLQPELRDVSMEGYSRFRM